MSQPQLQGRAPTSDAERYAQAVKTVSLVALVACPVLALLPPRKLDFFTFGLVGTTVYSGNYLLQDYTGRSIWQHVTRAPVSNTAAISRIPTSSMAGELQAQGRSTAGESGGTLPKKRDQWIAERQREIKEELEEGKGFGDMMMDQVKEIWTRAKPDGVEKRDDE